jgi:amidase
MADADLAFAGLARQAELVRAGEVSSRELVELCLARIARLDPVLNAFRVTFPERALAEADQADGRRGAGDTRPLLGVPIAIKDDCDVGGEVTGMGTDAVDPTPARADAEVVRRLRTAGAVIVGKTHVPELAIFPFTESPVYGVTRNPWDLDRTSGGSSGGSASAVAAGLVPAALGSDGAGSIRIPSGCCGLFGLKPQRGRVPTAPRVEPWNGMAIWGPLTRRVLDSAIFYDAIRDGGGSFAEAARAEPGRLRIGLVTVAPPFAGVKPDAEQLGAAQGTADLLRELGHEVVDATFDLSPAAGGNVLARYLRGIADEADTLAHPERLSRRARGFVRAGRVIPRAAVRRAVAAADADATRLNGPFDRGLDVLLTPMFTRRPPRVRQYEGRPALWVLNGAVRLVPWCGPYNHTGQPAAAVPAGFAADGFPLSAQIVAPPGREDVLLSLAAQLERARDWPALVPPIAA